jgi:uncharacterized protein (TIGR04141 family)
MPRELDEFIDFEEHPGIAVYGPVDRGSFIAKLYISFGPPRAPGWSGFVHAGFEDLEDLPRASSVGAVIVVQLVPEAQYFAYTFGTTGRFLLKHEVWRRGYGLIAALNLINPRGTAAADEGKLVAVGTKRRGGSIIRERKQSSRATSIEALEVDKLRDLVNGATGEPYDRVRWGSRTTGADTLTFAADTSFQELGQLTRDVVAAHDRDDYKERYAWLDAVRPIYDPTTVSRIENHLMDRLLKGDLTDLDLAPPELLDWDRVVAFRYHYEFRQEVDRADMQLATYMSGLLYHHADNASIIDTEFLKRRSIRAVDGSGHQIHHWSVWRCLTGEFEFEGATYIVDEGEIFEVSADFLADLNAYISALPSQDTMPWPLASVGTSEDAFNKAAATALAPAVLMDKKLVDAHTQTTPIEVCDILTATKKLIHVKRNFSSKELSHLFSQGFVSASLLQGDNVFREATHRKIKELGGDRRFDFFDVQTLPTTEYEVVFVIVGAYQGRSLTEALPFFSKVNLERTVAGLQVRNYRVSMARVDTRPPTPARGHRT